MENINDTYFKTLITKAQNSSEEDIILHQPEKGINSNIICIPIASEDDLKTVNIENYENLSDNTEKLKEYTYTVIKMQAGLGSSVDRYDLLEKVEGRTEVGAKGTDLYFKVNDELKSIAYIQMKQANALAASRVYKGINYKNLVNAESAPSVKRVEDSITSLDETLKILPPLTQNKMPTIGEDGELTTERVAPAGHGFIGVAVILETFLENISSDIVAIGNGEDLCSTPDNKIINWVIENNLPIVMITTTKTEADKKGGQISIVKGEQDLVTIVEKAQAEKANQLEYFEELGLRDGDKESLFNTNIVVINKKALKEAFNENLGDISTDDFLGLISPDVIKNVKEQDGKKFTQIESALGSVVLNLDKSFRLKYNKPLISFLNLNPNDRKRFFMPIKKRADYDYIFDNFKVDHDTFRLVESNT